MKTYHKIIFSIALFSLLLFIWTFTYGKLNNIEFINPTLQTRYYIFLIIVVPLSLLLTFIILNRSLKDLNDKVLNLMLVLGLACFTFIVCMDKWFFYYPWITESRIDRADDKNNIVLKQYKHDIGPGKPHKRTVTVKPFLFYFWEIIDEE